MGLTVVDDFDLSDLTPEQWDIIADRWAAVACAQHRTRWLRWLARLGVLVAVLVAAG